MKTENDGDDLIITFEGVGNGINENNFAAKLIGRTNQGKLLFGYARLPWVDYMEPVLSARLPEITRENDVCQMTIEVQNFGQVLSNPTPIEIEYVLNGQMVHLASANVPVLRPFQKVILDLPCETILNLGTEYSIRVSLVPEGQNPVLLSGLVSLGE